MGQGDGDAVAALCMQLEPEVLFLDFDRTLATTRSGGSPLDGVHALDVELADLMAAGVPTWVVTRNRHVVEIGAFLKSKGVHAAGVSRATACAVVSASGCVGCIFMFESTHLDCTRAMCSYRC